MPKRSLKLIVLASLFAVMPLSSVQSPATARPHSNCPFARPGAATAPRAVATGDVTSSRVLGLGRGTSTLAP
jgi:hypothetical protein